MPTKKKPFALRGTPKTKPRPHKPEAKAGKKNSPSVKHNAGVINKHQADNSLKNVATQLLAIEATVSTWDLMTSTSTKLLIAMKRSLDVVSELQQNAASIPENKKTLYAGEAEQNAMHFFDRLRYYVQNIATSAREFAQPATPVVHAIIDNLSPIKHITATYKAFNAVQTQSFNPKAIMQSLQIAGISMDKLYELIALLKTINSIEPEQRTANDIALFLAVTFVLSLAVKYNAVKTSEQESLAAQRPGNLNESASMIQRILDIQKTVQTWDQMVDTSTQIRKSINAALEIVAREQKRSNIPMPQNPEITPAELEKESMQVVNRLKNAVQNLRTGTAQLAKPAAPILNAILENLSPIRTMTGAYLAINEINEQTFDLRKMVGGLSAVGIKMDKLYTLLSVQKTLADINTEHLTAQNITLFLAVAFAFSLLIKFYAMQDKPGMSMKSHSRPRI